ncbi:MAG: L-threonylcarbamoyladenylate synthase [Gemmataceae bacterium]
MNTEILRVDPVSPEPAVIAKAAGLLRAGRLVAFPTETIYGLGANALNSEAVRGIFAAKGRPASNPVIVHVAEPSQISNVAADWPETARKLAERFWPGPLTIVVPKKPGVPDEVTAGGPTVAVRCPNHPVARALIAAAGVPIAAPSANRSTELSPTRAGHVLKGLAGRIEMVLDGGPCPGGLESTVVDVTGPAVRLLRRGLISVPMLEDVVGPLANREREQPETVARSPGQMAKHYSPRTPVQLTLAREDTVRAVQTALQTNLRVGVLLRNSDSVPEISVVPGYRFLDDDPNRYAAWMYQALHEFDDRHLDIVVIEMPPDTPEWAAVRDRLTRAAAGN